MGNVLFTTTGRSGLKKVKETPKIIEVTQNPEKRLKPEAQEKVLNKEQKFICTRSPSFGYMLPH